MGDEHTIRIGAGTRADVARRFRDQHGRPPSTDELAQALLAWQREEALYREGLKDGLDRDDAAVRSVVADHVRFRAAQEAPKRAPTEAELRSFLDQHRERYAAPLRYDYELVRFDPTPGGEEELRAYEAALAEGHTPASLGRPVQGGGLTQAELSERLGSALALAIAGLPEGGSLRFEQPTHLLYVRLTQRSGGVPSFDTLRPRLESDWANAREEAAVERAIERIVAGYRFEAEP